MKPGIVVFAGAGPGAVDLMSIRCRDAVADADVIVYAGSLVNPEVLKWAKSGCAIYDSAGMNLEQILDVLVGGAKAGRKVLRLHTGDPSIYGAIAEQMRLLRKAGIDYEVIPGISSVFASAAAIKAELTVPGCSQTVILTRRAGRTPVPAGQDIASLASHKATMAVFLSAGDTAALAAELVAGGYEKSTPVAIVYRASWKDEKIIRCRLDELDARATSANITRQALVLIGDSLAGEGNDSLLYAASFQHGYRSADAGSATVSPRAALSVNDGFTGKVAIYALTKQGCQLAQDIASKSGYAAFVSSKHARDIVNGKPFDPEQLGAVIKKNWVLYEGHVFIMAAGIAVRKIAPLLKSKTIDPAVVVCDEKGSFAVSLIGGHIGGANRLAGSIARLTGGAAVISTATDIQGRPAFDDVAARMGMQISNPEKIKALNTLLLEAGKIAVRGAGRSFRKIFFNVPNITWLESSEKWPSDSNGAVDFDGKTASKPKGKIPVLQIKSKPVVLGIGCRRGVTCEEVLTAVSAVLDCLDRTNADVRIVASIDIKSDEAGLNDAVRKLGLKIRHFGADTLKKINTPTRSKVVEAVTGSPSVCEAAAIAAGKGRILMPKIIHGRVTIAVATWEKDEK